MATLSFRKVKKTYAGNVPVIHGIDMDVKDGEFIVIVGPSGCVHADAHGRRPGIRDQR